MKLFAACAVAAALSAVATAATPVLDRVEGAVLQRRGRCRVTLVGQNLSGIGGALFYRPGLRLEGVEAASEGAATLVVSAEADCPLGEHPFNAFGPAGVAPIATLHVSPFPIRDEASLAASASIDTPRTISPLPAEGGVTITGVVDGAEVDAFAVELDAGDRLSAEAVGVRLGGAFFDAALEVAGPDGRVIVSCDDSTLAAQDPVASIVAERSGRYVVRVREAAFGGDPESRYLLHVGHFPRPTVAWPVAARRGETTPLLLLGQAGPPLAAEAQAPADAGERFAFFPQTPSGVTAPTPVWLAASDAAPTVEAEPNDNPAAATPAIGTSAPIAFDGRLEAAGDADHFAFQAARGDRLEVVLLAARVGSPLDGVLTLLGPDGRAVATSDDLHGRDSGASFTVARDGRHVVRVADHLGRGGDEFVYRVEVRRPAPRLELAVVSHAPTPAQRGESVLVPRRGRAAALVTVRRQGFSGDVALDVAGLPEGVAAEARPVAADGHVALITFTADERASGAALASVRGRSESEPPVEGELAQRVGLVFGDPRQTVYHAVEVSRVPVAVVAPSPFEVEVAPPGARLAQDGRLDLRVRVRRAEGFRGEVTLATPVLPAWVERSESPVVIPADQTEGLYPLVAGPRAVEGTTPLVVVATAEDDAGPLPAVAAAAIDLGVAAPYAEAAIARTSTEQGAAVRVPCALTWRRDAPPGVTATLRGLPKGASAAPLAVAPGQGELEFVVEVGEETPASTHNTLMVELAVPENGAAMTQFLGRGGVLEVYPRGGSPQETASRLAVLRARRAAPQGAAGSVAAERHAPTRGASPR